MAWVNPRTWVNGLVTAAMMNEIRDSLKAIGDPWTAYTPTWTAETASPTVGNATLAGRYRTRGKTVDFHIDLVTGSTSVAGTGAWYFGLPPSSTPLLTNASEIMGYGMTRDISVPAVRPLHAYYIGASVVGLIDSTTGSRLTSSSPFTWAAGDIISIHGSYEIA